jgi:hypothetical protein
VIIHNLNVGRIPVTPNEAETPLVVDAYTVPPLSVTTECLQTISGRCGQVAQLRCAVQLPELSARYGLNRLKTAAALPVVKPLGFSAAEQPDHNLILSRIAFNVKQYTHRYGSETGACYNSGFAHP